MTSLVIVHFSPVELYPPIQNLVLELEKQNSNFNIKLITTRNRSFDLIDFAGQSERVRIFRFAGIGRNQPAIIRYINYLKFYGLALLSLIIVRPKRVLYFETISSLPVYLYKKFISRTTELFIHYHEYTSPEQYQSIKLFGFQHRLEKRLFSDAIWVSHTNMDRLERFKKDLLPVQVKNPFILPNYPSLKWKANPQKMTHLPLKIVCVGALSLDTMYTEKFAHWVINQKGKVIWDIYSYNFTSDVSEFLNGLGTTFINLKPGVEYDKLPDILIGYSVGVILYTGHIPNIVYCAPNKLFEYLACGLDVWFPIEIKTAHDYTTKTTFPRVIPLDFELLDNFDPLVLTDKSGLSSQQSHYFCEDALRPLIQKLLDKND
jgi:hypothetical protein